MSFRRGLVSITSKFPQKRGMSSNTGAKDWLLRKGLSKTTADAVIAELHKGGLGSLQMQTVLETMGDVGVRDLVDAIERSNQRSGSSVTVRISVPKENRTFDLPIQDGQSLYDVVSGGGSELNSYLECACGGVMACSTCHVILDESLYSQLDSPCEAEQDMIDLACDVTQTSRLGCQLKISKAFEGKVITIPAGVNNLF